MIKKNYGQVLIWAAILVSMPRWAGAFIAADITQIPVFIDQLLHYMNLLSGFGMALLEVLGAAYLLDAWGKMKPKTSHNAKHLDHRWVILTGFVLGLFLLMPLILAPYVVSRMTGTTVASIGNGVFHFLWSIAVVMSPIFIVGGASVARGEETVVKTKVIKPEVPERQPKKPLRETTRRLSGTKLLVSEVHKENPDLTHQEIADWLSENHNINITRQAVGKHVRSLNGVSK